MGLLRRFSNDRDRTLQVAHLAALAVLAGFALLRIDVGYHPTPGRGDGGKCVPSGHLPEGQNDPQSSTEARAGHG